MIDFNKLYNNSWGTVIGVDGVDEWKDGIQLEFDENNIGQIQEWAVYTGGDINRFYNINEFPDNLHILSFSLDGLNINKLAIFRIKDGGWFRWFDDIIDNIINKEEEEEE